MPLENDTDPYLVTLRDQIDAIDAQVVELLAERARLAQAVGTFKHGRDLPTYVPGRERDILAGLTPSRVHPFPLKGAQAVFREVISACRSLEDVPVVAYLGPQGTYTEVAARTVWGECADYRPFANIDRLFAGLRADEAYFGVVPIENSTAGTIREVLDQLATGGDSLTIVGEAYVPIHHCLLAHSLDMVTEVWSKDSALDQCKGWLRANLPRATLVPVASTAMGVEAAAADPSKAGIGTELAGQRYGVGVLARNIEDLHDNRTRFFVLGRDVPKPSGSDKTSILMYIEHRPGALVRALEVLRRHGLNMTLIESRPSRSGPFEYAFFIDFEGHIADEDTLRGVEELESVCSRVVRLGSYPKAL